MEDALAGNAILRQRNKNAFNIFISILNHFLLNKLITLTELIEDYKRP